MNAYQIGPCADLNRARTGRDGILLVENEGRRLRFIGKDGKQVGLCSLDPVELVKALLAALPFPVVLPFPYTLVEL